MSAQVTIADAKLCLDVLEDEVRGVDLTVRMRIADPDRFTLVLENQDEEDVGMRRELRIWSCQVASSASTPSTSSSASVISWRGL